jgi:hypothetical protein
MGDLAKKALSLVKKIQKDSSPRYLPPSEGTRPRSEMVLPRALVKGTRGYIEKITNQINGSYEFGWYDGCAVMMRRLIETLLIEAFEKHAIDHKVKNADGDFIRLSEIINATIIEPKFNLDKKTKKALPKLKEIGDKSAHNRRFNAHREDIDNIQAEFRTAIQELLYISGLK